MIAQKPWQGLRLSLLLLLALVSMSGSAYSQSQTLAYAGCVPQSSIMQNVLQAPAALSLGIHAELQTYNTCVAFCRDRAIPSKQVYKYAEARGDLSNFRGGYTYITLTDGNWCYCGDQINAQLLSLDNCRQQIACLSSPGVACSETEADEMIFTVGSGGGGGAGGGAGGGQPPPPPPTANRQPYAPTLQPGGFEPPIPLRYEGAVQMTWQNNGDPDGDPLTFGVFIMYFDWAQRMWVQVPTLRDYMGVYGRVWVTDPYYTFTVQAGLRPNTYYSWMVFACDMNRGDNTLCSWSGWSQFRTVE